MVKRAEKKIGVPFGHRKREENKELKSKGKRKQKTEKRMATIYMFIIYYC